MSIFAKLSKDKAKKLYRKLAKEHHPDRGGSSKKFSEIQEQYSSHLKNEDPESEEFSEHEPDLFSFGELRYGELLNLSRTRFQLTHQTNRLLATFNNIIRIRETALILLHHHKGPKLTVEDIIEPLFDTIESFWNELIEIELRADPRLGDRISAFQNEQDVSVDEHSNFYAYPHSAIYHLVNPEIRLTLTSRKDDKRFGLIGDMLYNGGVGVLSTYALLEAASALGHIDPSPEVLRSRLLTELNKGNYSRGHEITGAEAFVQHYVGFYTELYSSDFATRGISTSLNQYYDAYLSTFFWWIKDDNPRKSIEYSNQPEDSANSVLITLMEVCKKQISTISRLENEANDPIERLSLALEKAECLFCMGNMVEVERVLRETLTKLDSKASYAEIRAAFEEFLTSPGSGMPLSTVERIVGKTN